MKVQPIFLHREFESIVKNVSDKLISYLKDYDDAITAVHYHYGHPLEIINTITQYDQGNESKYDKYPLVAFFLDSSINRGREVGLYGEQEVNICIIRDCNDAQGNDVASVRDEKNFIPVLNPIYLELLEQIALRGDLFNLQGGAENIEHKVTNRYYWGRSGLFGNDGNIFNDRVDAIEINNMKLRINLNYCPKPAV